MPNSSLLDFWQWAFGDLCDDDIKGIFAEWVVYKLLSADGTRRVSWADKDILVKGVKIEVKASAYWQSWKLVNPDGTQMQHPDANKKTNAEKVVFKGLKARTAEPAIFPDFFEEKLNTEIKYKSDLYVFAFQHEENWELWNAMDLDQWEFYLVPVSELKYESISLRSLRSLSKGPYSAVQFQEKAIRAIQALFEEQTERANL